MLGKSQWKRVGPIPVPVTLPVPSSRGGARRVVLPPGGPRGGRTSRRGMVVRKARRRAQWSLDTSFLFLFLFLFLTLQLKTIFSVSAFPFALNERQHLLHAARVNIFLL